MPPEEEPYRNTGDNFESEPGLEVPDSFLRIGLTVRLTTLGHEEIPRQVRYSVLHCKV